MGSPGAGMTGSGKRAHSADICAASMVTSSAATISPQPMATSLTCHSNSAPAASSTAAPSTAVAVKNPAIRSRSALGTIKAISDHAVTPAAASITCAGPNLPGTASTSAAAMGTSAAIDSAVPVRAERAVTSRPTIAVSAATALTATSPDSAPVATR